MIGDEVGLLLTFGNYWSQLTYVFGVGFLALAILGLLFASYKDRLKEDVTGLGTYERLVHIGVVVAGLSVAAFSVNAFIAGSTILVVGVAVALVGARGLRVSTEKSPPNHGR